MHSDYRYAFNSKEKDDEVQGRGNSLDFGARVYDSRIGRFLSVDPDVELYPSMSPYCFAANSPVALIDEEGKGPRHPPQYRGFRAGFRNSNWLQTRDANNRSNFNKGPRPKVFRPRPTSIEPYQIITLSETWSGEVNAKYPRTRKEPEPFSGTYNIVEAMQIISKAYENSKEYFEKTKVVYPADYNENTGAHYSEIVITEIYVVIPNEVLILEDSYQAAIKSSAQGTLTDDEFKKLPIQEQTARYNSAQLLNGTSPKNKYIELVKNGEASGTITPSNATPKSTTAGAESNTKTSTDLLAAPSYNK